MFPKRKYDFNYQAPSSISGLTTIEDIEKVSPFFSQTNPVTYAIYLQANENKLTQYEISQIKSFMNHLMCKEQEAMESISKFLKDKREYEPIDESANKVIVQPISSSLEELSSSSSPS